ERDKLRNNEGDIGRLAREVLAWAAPPGAVLVLAHLPAAWAPLLGAPAGVVARTGGALCKAATAPRARGLRPWSVPGAPPARRPAVPWRGPGSGPPWPAAPRPPGGRRDGLRRGPSHPVRRSGAPAPATGTAGAGTRSAGPTSRARGRTPLRRRRTERRSRVPGGGPRRPPQARSLDRERARAGLGTTARGRSPGPSDPTRSSGSAAREGYSPRHRARRCRTPRPGTRRAVLRKPVTGTEGAGAMSTDREQPRGAHLVG